MSPGVSVVCAALCMPTCGPMVCRHPVWMLQVLCSAQLVTQGTFSHALSGAKPQPSLCGWACTPFAAACCTGAVVHVPVVPQGSWRQRHLNPPAAPHAWQAHSDMHLHQGRTPRCSPAAGIFEMQVQVHTQVYKHAPRMRAHSTRHWLQTDIGQSPQQIGQPAELMPVPTRC